MGQAAYLNPNWFSRREVQKAGSYYAHGRRQQVIDRLPKLKHIYVPSRHTDKDRGTRHYPRPPPLISYKRAPRSSRLQYDSLDMELQLLAFSNHQFPNQCSSGLTSAYCTRPYTHSHTHKEHPTNSHSFPEPRLFPQWLSQLTTPPSTKPTKARAVLV